MRFFKSPETKKAMSGNRFLYHAHGMALGGRISQPFQAEIDGQATTSLASIGGHSSTKAGAYTLNDFISYESAHCYVSGSRSPDGVYHTSSTCIVRGLNILHVVTADAIIGRLSAKHTGEGPPEITPIGSQFDNLRIAGQPVHVDLDHEKFAQHPTYTGLLNHVSKKTKSKTAPKLRYQWGLTNDEIPAPLEEGMLVPADTGWRENRGVLSTSMVKTVQPIGPGTSTEELPYGYAIHIPHVGNLYLAEIFATSDSKRLCMLRLELGCPVHGMVAAAEPWTNGIQP
jgi:hypothetical protein